MLRTIVQEKAKQDVLTNLNKESTLLIMDWAMKFLPMKFRERMDDFYAKRGRSWHVTCSIKRASEDEDRVEVDTFVHIFDSCTHPSPNFSYVLITPVVITTLSFS